MNQKSIGETLHTVEKEYSDSVIDIVSARDVGSRMMGLESEDSDYDVMILFTQPATEYASLSGYKDSIDRTFRNGEIDIRGWNIKKFVKLALDSNPTVIEFLNSDEIYYETENAETRLLELQEMMNENFVPIALYKHYISMAKQNYEKYLQRYLYRASGEEHNTSVRVIQEYANAYDVVIGDQKRTIEKSNESWEADTVEQTVKKNLFVLRAALYAEHIRLNHTVPEYDFPKFVKSGLPGPTGKKLEEEVPSLIEKKRAGDGDRNFGNPYSQHIRRMLNAEMEHQSLPRSIDREMLDEFVRDMVR